MCAMQDQTRARVRPRGAAGGAGVPHVPRPRRGLRADQEAGAPPARRARPARRQGNTTLLHSFILLLRGKVIREQRSRRLHTLKVLVDVLRHGIMNLDTIYIASNID